VTFPVTVEFYDQRAKIYKPAKGFPFYRVAFKVSGKRKMLTFGSYSEAKAAAEAKVKELHKGQLSSGLTAKESEQAIAIRDALADYRKETGRKVSALEAVQTFIAAAKLLPDGREMIGAIRSYRQSISTVQRKPLSQAVKDFCDARKLKTIAEGGERPQLSPVYQADVERQLNEFADTNLATDVCDLTKQHLDLFLESKSGLSAKSRNHYRATLRMFLGWCARRDYLPANHRLLEADGLRKEDTSGGDVELYTPKELQTLLDNADDELAVIIALQAFGGLRLQEALRLDWKDVWTIPDHIEISSAKAKTRSRRLVEINPTLAAWLKPHSKKKECAVTSKTLDMATWDLIQLRKSQKVPSRKNGFRHGFLSAHFAIHQNEGQTAAIAGTSPQMLFKHYRGKMTKAEAEKWFAVKPTSK
jgi:integrase